ncbi:threonine-rich protein-like [Diabrotica virgifera virgifera]|uniref:Threonine-rich protein-like n=1 Tax=Diabrotica virgifera virgifera TaxID=50390 RepID=A0A6P7GNZ0_DIAVI|nr:threonine-rich protein-like [Diabrotica virgifera virgifera]
MKRSVLVFTLLIFTFSFIAGEPLTCYKCRDALKGPCIDGDKNQMKTIECHEDEVCVTIQSKTTQGSNYYITATRGCDASDICEDETINLMKNTKTILCLTCNTTLCNSGSSVKSSILTVVFFNIFFYLATTIR